MHGSLQQNVVSIDCLGDGLEAVGISRDANKVGGDEANDGKHGSAAVTDFGLTEEGYEGGVGFGEAEWVEFEVTAFEVFSSDAVFCYCVSLIFLCRICRVKKVSREVKLMEQRDDHVAIEDKSRSEDTVHETETETWIVLLEVSSSCSVATFTLLTIGPILRSKRWSSWQGRRGQKQMPMRRGR